MTRRSFALAALPLIAFLTGACATSGRNFQRPEAGTLLLGKTTEADRRDRFGEPRGVSVRTMNEKVVTQLQYSYAEARGYVEKISTRSCVFAFSDGVLVGHDYSSSFSDDKTDFDESVAHRIKRFETTAAEVVALIGSPTGEAIYPVAKAKDGKLYRYSYSRTDKNPLDGRRQPTRSKILVIEVDASGIVTDVSLNSQQ